MLRPSELKKIAAEKRKQLTDQYRTYFENHHGLQYVRALGKGAAAGTLLFEELDRTQPRTKQRGVVVKYAFAEQHNKDRIVDRELRDELGWLGWLRGAEHIVQLVSLDTDVDQDVHPRPVFVMEYLEYGSIKNLCERFVAIQRQVPNRILWGALLCCKGIEIPEIPHRSSPDGCATLIVLNLTCSVVTRACIAMDYPPWRYGERETIPSATAPLDIIHGDLHDENVMIGSLFPRDGEHGLAPLLKLIDFGNAKQIPRSTGYGSSSLVARICSV
ncbi:hypothetical protein F5Y15DRAFT_382847 [Xylariaceae sp. FL0016]|nr:hypothetical protein F5Y15DRAFT_382847 [Xylariaceae sp. FL0016]